jgi:uncharacterized lipoprotein YmbA
MRYGIYTALRYSVMLLLSLLLAGCLGGGATTPVRYYLVDEVEPVNVPFSSDKPLIIEIIDLHIPQYLERFNIATRSAENRLVFSEYNQWGENFRKNLMRTMARNLSKLLSTVDIGTPMNRSMSLPDYRIQIYIEKFEQDIDSKVRLVARWQLSDAAEPKPLDIYSAELESNIVIEESDYDQIVSVMRELYGEFSNRIAATIIAEENK